MKSSVANKIPTSFFRTIYLVAFLWALGIALPEYILSSYLERFAGVATVGYFYVAATVITLISLLFFARIIRRFGNYRVALVVVVLTVLAKIGMIVADHVALAVASFIAYWLLGQLLLITFDVFIENITNNKQTGRVQATYLTVQNIGWLLAAILMGQLAQRFASFGAVFAASAVCIAMIFFVLLVKRSHFKHLTEYRSRSPHQLLRLFLRRRDLRNDLLLSFTLQFFYAIMVLYMPIYLHQVIGFSFGTIGIMFGIMLLPFVLVQMPAGYIADHFMGEKEMLIVGLVIMLLTSVAIAFLRNDSVVAWTVLLFVSRIGAALLEAMQQIYFFKKIGPHDSDLINLFRDQRPAAFLVGSVVGVLSLTFLPFWALFLVLGLFLFLALWPAIQLRDTN